MSDTPKDTLRSTVTGWPSKTARYTSSRQQERDAAVDDPASRYNPDERRHRELIAALRSIDGTLCDVMDALKAILVRMGPRP